ncbi:MAG: hypothetical protein ACWA5P_11670 [bacterium]
MKNILVVLSICFCTNIAMAQKEKTSTQSEIKAQYLKQIDSIDTEIANLNCPQLRALLNVKNQQLSNVLNDIQIFNKFITDLNEEKAASSAAYDQVLKSINFYENRYQRVFDILIRCINRGGSEDGECPREEQAYIETSTQLQKYRALGEERKKELQAILDELQTYLDLREKATNDSVRLNAEISRIKRRMERLGCRAL